MSPTQHVVIAVRCRECDEMVLGTVVNRTVQIHTHTEQHSDARCTGSRSVVPLPEVAR